MYDTPPVGIPEHQKGYLVCVPSTRKIISSYDVVFDDSFSSVFAYTSQPYSEAMVMRPAVTYKPCATSSTEQTDDIIKFAQFEEGNILTKTRNDAESRDESNNESIMMSEQDMDAMNYGDDSDHDLIYIYVGRNILWKHTYTNVNRREARYKLRDCIRQRQ